MRILLVGGLGFIGKRFIRKFANIHEIVVYTPQENPDNSKQHFRNIKIEKGKVEDEKIRDVILSYHPDAVVHLAALTGIKKCLENPENAFRINVYGTFNVVKACSLIGCKLIFISSREVYGETQNIESKEDDPLLPKSTYGITKMLSEILIIQEGLEKKLDYTILRLTNVYGPEGDHYGAQVIIRKAITEKKVQVLGGKQRLNYVYVDDVVDLINLIVDDKRTSGEIFNVGSKYTLTIEEFVEEVSKSIGTELDIEYLPMRETETIDFRPSLKKLEMFGFSTNTSIRNGIQKTIEWYSDNIDNMELQTS